uniref:Uncharacterized protein n=1 Tax=Solanum lycopersicum TaxID=4081 RepID=A0A3Q7FK69_SOLLC
MSILVSSVGTLSKIGTLTLESSIMSISVSFMVTTSKIGMLTLASSSDVNVNVLILYLAAKEESEIDMIEDANVNILILNLVPKEET